MRKLLLAAVVLFASSSFAQNNNDAAAFTVSLWGYHVEPNIVYHTANNYQDRLDVYTPPAGGAPTPVAIIIHGGGWIAGKKEERVMEVMPYLQMGFAAVNVEYRMADVSPAPAAVVDCRCALHWVVANAKKYNFDVNRIVVTGGSAGGHLALTTGMLTSAAGFDRECWAADDPVWKKTGGTAGDPHVAAIVNWFGITDVLDEIHGPNTKGYAVIWIGDQPNADEIAKRVSPINMVSKDNPPILTIHGDHDELVPYSQAVRLKQELDQAGVPNQLYTVVGGNHGGFSPEEMQKIWATIRQFLNQNLKTPATK
ncbi:MAG TPA: alpha/beta hydrolase [Terriglobales bacterium]|nr:alpha/beta hydrolase [Terriglobales bacterium]